MVVWIPADNFIDHRPSQLCATGVAFAAVVQTRHQGYGKNRRTTKGGAKSHGHQDPIVTRSGRYTLLGGGNSITKPTDAPNGLATFVSQGVVHQQSNDTTDRQTWQVRLGHRLVS